MRVAAARAGSLELWPNGSLRAGGAVSRWSYSTHLAGRHLKKYPDAYLVVRFEDLIRNTEKTLQNICAFLGEDFYSEMLSMPEAEEHRDKLIRRSKKGPGESPLSDEYIGIYREVVPKLEVGYIQLFIGKLMKSYGYELDSVNLTWGERVKFLFVTLPLNLVRMTLWGMRELLEQKFPNTVRRSPGSNMIIESKTDPQKV